MIIANFINKQDALVTGLDQYDYGQVLHIQGLNFPTAVEIHFGLEETGGTTTTRIGVTKDGVTDVPIPDSMLENGDTSLDYTIYAFIYLTDETSGKTVHRIRMQVKARSKPELLNKPEDKELFQKAIEAVNRSAKEAEGWAHGREDMPERAMDNAKYYAGESAKSAESVKGVEQNVKDMVATIGGIEQQVQDVKTYAGQAQSASEKALLSEQEAKKSEGAALQHRTGAETAENNAELAESNAKKSEQAVEQAKQLVMQMGQEVLQNKNQVDEKVEAFNKVVTDASDAIGTAKTDAVDTVETAGTEQNKKVSDEGAKQVKAVEDKGNEVLQSIPEDFTTQMQSKLDKNQGAENKDKILGIGADGLVVPIEKPSGGSGGDGIPIINTMSGESPLVVPDSAERVNKGFSLIGKSEQVTTTGANLIPFPYTDKDMSKNGVTFEVQQDGGVNIYGTAIESVDFFLSMLDYGNDSIFNNGKGNGKILSGGKNGVEIEYHGTNKRLHLTIAKGKTVNTVIYPQLQNGSTATPYEPYTGGKPSPSPSNPQEIKNVGKQNPKTQKYEVDIKVTNAKESWDKEQTLTITSDRPITKWDKLVEQDGQIGWLYKSQIIDRLDGKSNKVSLGTKKGEVQHFSIEFKNTPKGNGNTDIYVDKYRAVPSSYALEEFGICCNWNDGIKYFSAPNINITNTEEFKAWLSENPLTLEYETETPEFVPLPQSEQDAIRALSTYYPTTVITTDGGEVNPDIEVSYIADTKNYIDQKIAAIGKTVVETQKALL